MSEIDYRDIYARHVEAYDAMVAAEDADGNLPRALAELVELPDARVLEVGVGTGRVTRLLLAAGARVVGVDRSPQMLEVARRHLERLPRERWALVRADAERLPFGSGWADAAIEGWALGHLRYENPEEWRRVLGDAVAEMRRALRPGGRMVLIETLGIGTREPQPPSPEQGAMYDWLERDHGLGRRVIRTDYAFADPDAAARGTGFFFGARFAERVRRERWARVPEFTGLWSNAAG